MSNENEAGTGQVGDRRLRRGDVVQWEGQTCVVRRRRAVDGFAMFQTDTHEVFLASIEVGGLSPEWVPEGECVRVVERGETTDVSCTISGEQRGQEAEGGRDARPV